MYSAKEFKEDFLLNIDNMQLRKAIEESDIFVFFIFASFHSRPTFINFIS